MIHHSDWTFHGFAKVFDGHVREQLPWYELASAAMGLIARQYIPKGGKVYDLGASTGNVGRVLAPTLEARCARLTALDECPDMVEAYNAPGRALRADITRFDYKPFDVAVAFLALMFLAVPARRKLLTRLRQQLRPGGAIIIFDKLVPPGGYPATVLARLTWASKLDQGAEPGAVVKRACPLRHTAPSLPWRARGGRRGSLPLWRLRRVAHRRITAYEKTCPAMLLRHVFYIRYAGRVSHFLIPKLHDAVHKII